MKIRNLLLASYLLAASLVPLPASAAVVCENGICTETFEFTGSAQTWQVPSGVTKISFKVFGASGGRGGAGGEVRGELNSLPAVLSIYVGGQGTEGNYAPGGFNGGGATTGNRGNEGSGGGASDIRFGSSLSDRVVVAGGGGGSGGYAGAPGGMGGGLVAETGGSGQGGGGGGGTQTSGGSAGYSNGGSPASGGSFGVGGTGGFSWNAGGGGGGGGWYGGGGGGPDDNSCCSDGGGGGGGSSYARSDITTNVQHQQGVNTGDGRIEISYQQPITVVSFSGEQISSNIAQFNLVMSLDIAGLTPDDFTATQTCQVSEITLDAKSSVITLTECSHGEVMLTLKAGAIGESPSSDLSVTILFDKQPPEFSWGEASDAIAQDTLATTFTLSEGVLEISSLDVGSCRASVDGNQLNLEDCPEGINTISLLPGQLVDQWGNSGPAEAISFFFLVDLTSPEVIWSEVEITRSENFRYEVILTISELTDFDPLMVNFVTDSECQSGYEQAEAGWLFFADCGFATGSWSLPEFSLLDSVGNKGPAQPRIAMFENLEPVVESQPVESEVVSEDPVQSAPTQPEPVQPPAVDSSPEVPQQQPVEQVIQIPAPLEPLPQEPESEFVLETPPLIEATPPAGEINPAPVQETTITEEVRDQVDVKAEVEIIDEVVEEQPISEEVVTEGFEAEPVIASAAEQESSTPMLLFFLLGAIALIGVIGLRIIGR